MVAQIGENLRASSNRNDGSVAVPAALGVTASGLEISRRALTGSVILVATPDAFKSGHRGLWGLELAVQKATNEVVPYNGDLSRLGHTWKNGWSKIFMARNAMLAATSVATLAMGLPVVANITTGGDIKDLWSTREGRTATIATGMGSYVTARIVGGGMAKANGGFVRSALTSPKLGSWAVAGPAMAVWGAIMANKMGAFDFLGE